MPTPDPPRPRRVVASWHAHFDDVREHPGDPRAAADAAAGRARARVVPPLAAGRRVAARQPVDQPDREPVRPGALYGGGALLIREVARRTGRGWPAIVVLALAYGLLEEGLLTQMLFSPTYHGWDIPRDAHLPPIGVDGYLAVSVLAMHAVWSIGVPIALVEALVPGRATAPWLGRPASP